MRYANAAERLLAAIGESQMIDTAKDARLEFVARMVGRGYTERQVRRLVKWYMRVKQAS